MKHLTRILFTPILSLSLTLTPLMAQAPSASTNETTDDSPTTVASASANQELHQKTSDSLDVVLPALPSQNKATPAGRSSRAVIGALIVAGAAVVTAIILLFRGGNTPGTVLAPGTATVGSPSH